MHVLQIGAYPPPFGGNSVHLKRLVDALIERGVSCNVFDLYGAATLEDPPYVSRLSGPKVVRALKLMIALPSASRGKLVHFHVSDLRHGGTLLGPLLIASRRAAGRVITIHSGRFVRSFRESPRAKAAYVIRLLQMFERIVTVNGRQREFLVHAGVDPARVVTIPAFIPDRLPKRLSAPPDIQRLKDGNIKVIVIAGYGTSTYGYDILAAALKRVRELGYIRELAVVLVTYNEYHDDYMKSVHAVLETIEKLQIMTFSDLRPEEFVSLLNHCDIFVRPTRSEGDSVALREAAQAGCQLVASDCAPRPAGVLLFKNGNDEALAYALHQALCDRSLGKVSEVNIDAVGPLLREYNLVLNGRLARCAL